MITMSRQKGYINKLSSGFFRSIPAGTKRCFNVETTLFGRFERWMDVGKTSCAGWDSLIKKGNVLLINKHRLILVIYKPMGALSCLRETVEVY